jgi:hypothetical protein
LAPDPTRPKLHGWSCDVAVAVLSPRRGEYPDCLRIADSRINRGVGCSRSRTSPSPGWQACCVQQSPVTIVLRLEVTGCSPTRCCTSWGSLPGSEGTLPTRGDICSTARIPPVTGRALDVGCGSGRDAVYLAKRGWTVTAVDSVDKALATARRRAAEEGVEVQWVKGHVAALDWLGLEPATTSSTTSAASTASPTRRAQRRRRTDPPCRARSHAADGRVQGGPRDRAPAGWTSRTSSRCHAMAGTSRKAGRSRPMTRRRPSPRQPDRVPPHSAHRGRLTFHIQAGRNSTRNPQRFCLSCDHLRVVSGLIARRPSPG